MGFTKIIYIVNHKSYNRRNSSYCCISRLLFVLCLSTRTDVNMGFKFASALMMLAMAGVLNADNSAQREIARSSQLFAARVYQELKSESGNILVCPVSVQTVLALVQAGAKGDTSDEIQRALFLPSDKTVVQNGYEKLMNTLNNAKDVEMDIANRVYVKEGYTLNNNFKQIATKSFGADIENVDFAKNVDAAKKINNWVEEKTHDKIKDLIKSSDLDALTRMVLVNALYFKGKWVHPFEKWATHDRDFWLSATKSVKVPMMSQTANFKYAENAELDCKFLEMPYVGNEYAMTIVLPNKKDGLPALENRIAEVLQKQNYRDERVEVIMPLYKVETSIQFKEVLERMGMSKPFSGEADFSGLLNSPEKLAISKIIQKNFINVTEEGTEAASATAVGVVTLSLPSLPPTPIPFTADHPFLYFVHQPHSSHRKHQYIYYYVDEFETKDLGTIIFTGRIQNP